MFFPLYVCVLYAYLRIKLFQADSKMHKHDNIISVCMWPCTCRPFNTHCTIHTQHKLFVPRMQFTYPNVYNSVVKPCVLVHVNSSLRWQQGEPHCTHDQWQTHPTYTAMHKWWQDNTLYKWRRDNKLYKWQQDATHCTSDDKTHLTMYNWWRGTHTLYNCQQDTEHG